MILVIFPDIVKKYFQKNENVQKIINFGEDEGLKFVCHKKIIDEIESTLLESPQILNDFKYHVKIYEEDLPYVLSTSERLEIQQKNQIILAALANSLGISTVWSDNENLKRLTSLQIFTTIELLEKFQILKSKVIEADTIGSFGQMSNPSEITAKFQPTNNINNLSKKEAEEQLVKNIKQTYIWPDPPFIKPSNDEIEEEEKMAAISPPENADKNNPMVLLANYLRDELINFLKNIGLQRIRYDDKDNIITENLKLDDLPNFKMASEIREIIVENVKLDEMTSYLTVYEWERREGNKWLEPWEDCHTETPFLYFNIIDFFVNKRGRVLFNYTADDLGVHLYLDQMPDSIRRQQTGSQFTYPYADNINVNLTELIPQEEIDHILEIGKIQREFVDKTGLKKYFGLMEGSLKAKSCFFHVKLNEKYYANDSEFLFDITDLEKEFNEKRRIKVHKIVQDLGL